MKKEIGVFTLGNAKENYGQILQAYALQVFLKQNGYNPYLIDYQKKFTLEDERGVRKILKFFYLKFFLPFKLNKLKNKDKDESLSVKSRKFNEFYASNFRLSPTYTSVKELNENPPFAHAYITGSDQIWNWNERYGYEPAAFLQFGDSKINRISYAAGMSKIDDNPKAIKQLSTFLSRLNHISLREDNGVSIINKSGFNNVNVVCDPTLLLNPSDYFDIMKKPDVLTSKNYAVGYLINIKSIEDIGWESIKEYLESKDIEFIYTSSEGYIDAIDKFGDFENNYFTVPEWLYCFANSKIVFTTSYHGLLFSLIFEKPFVFYFSDNGHSYGRNRIYYILKKVGLSDRIYDPNNGNTISAILNRDINWNNVKELLQEFKIHSKNFLLRSLS